MMFLGASSPSHINKTGPKDRSDNCGCVIWRNVGQNRRVKERNKASVEDAKTALRRDIRATKKK